MTMLHRIKVLCEKKGQTLASLERAASLGQGTIRRWDNNYPSVDKLLKVANLLDVKVDYLLTGAKYSSDNELSEDEKELLDEFRKLDFKGKSAIMQNILNEQTRMNSASISKSMKDTIKTVDNFTTVTKPK